MSSSLTPDLTPEQEARAKQAFAEREFDPYQHDDDILGPALAPQAQVNAAEHDLAILDAAAALTPVQRDGLDGEVLAAQRERNRDLAEEFCFLDPADYENQEETSTGRILKPELLLHMLRQPRPGGCGLVCWFALSSEAFIAKQLNPRDVALAYRKIGQNPDNLHDLKRWGDAIADIRQEEAGRQQMCNYQRAGLWGVRGGAGARSPESEAEYITWIPCCWLREYALVKFDEQGVPDWYIPGWRDVLIALIRGQWISEETAKRVFGEAVGPRARRYHMILSGLRNAGSGLALSTESRVPTEEGVRGSGVSEPLVPDPLPGISCVECGHSWGHFLFCSQWEAWYKGLKE